MDQTLASRIYLPGWSGVIHVSLRQVQGLVTLTLPQASPVGPDGIESSLFKKSPPRNGAVIRLDRTLMTALDESLYSNVINGITAPNIIYLDQKLPKQFRPKSAMCADGVHFTNIKSPTEGVVFIGTSGEVRIWFDPSITHTSSLGVQGFTLTYTLGASKSPGKVTPKESHKPILDEPPVIALPPLANEEPLLAKRGSLLQEGPPSNRNLNSLLEDIFLCDAFPKSKPSKEEPSRQQSDSEIKTLTDSCRVRNDEMNTRLVTLQTTCSDQGSQLAKLQSTCTAQQAQIVELQCALKLATGTIRTLEEKLTALTDHQATLEERLTVLKDRTGTLEDQFTTQALDLKLQGETVTHIKGSVETLKGDMKDLRAQSTKWISQIETTLEYLTEGTLIDQPIVVEGEKPETPKMTPSDPFPPA